jgi:DNA-binding CsgD family transcriptional regulator
MSVKKDTIKFHVRNVLQKFGVETRSQLQQLLKEWDFNAWGDSQHQKYQ